MKIRLVIIAALFVLCHIVFAQPYNIRADARINLRSCAGTNCRVVEAVPAGTVLQVVDRFNRWLKISRDGAEVWMADWVNYTRIEGGSAPAAPAAQPEQPDAPAAQPAQPQDEVDNYCFTIWTCTTEEDWARGYHAYQNDKAAGTQPPGSDAAPPAPSGATFYEFLGAGNYTPGSAFLTAGTWEVRFIGAGWASVDAVEPAGQDCFGRWWTNRIWVLFKWSNWLGANNEEADTITLIRDCDITFEVEGSNRAWSLKLTKI